MVLEHDVAVGRRQDALRTPPLLGGLRLRLLGRRGRGWRREPLLVVVVLGERAPLLLRRLRRPIRSCRSVSGAPELRCDGARAGSGEHLRLHARGHARSEARLRGLVHRPRRR
jgi:hypothetical protein